MSAAHVRRATLSYFCFTALPAKCASSSSGCIGLLVQPLRQRRLQWQSKITTLTPSQAGPRSHHSPAASTYSRGVPFSILCYHPLYNRIVRKIDCALLSRQNIMRCGIMVQGHLIYLFRRVLRDKNNETVVRDVADSKTTLYVLANLRSSQFDAISHDRLGRQTQLSRLHFRLRRQNG